VAVDGLIPVVDLFAGPGGLGEGFSALGRSEGRPRFKVCLSIEKDAVAHQTLRLRAFFRFFKHGDVPSAYYSHLRGELSYEELFNSNPEAANAADREAWHAELGVKDPEEVRKRIREAIGGEDKWVLVGGPPCQAYSKAGRSRNRYRYRNKFNTRYVPEEDPRQYLYVEYLQVLADHRPAVFVMENVKGLLSATLENRRIFDRILEDLHFPAEAIRREGRSVATQYRSRYHIYSLERAAMFDGSNPVDFVVRSECHGIPQARHRVILLGVREDLRGASPNTLIVRDPVPAKAVLAGLPRLRSGLSKTADSAEEWVHTLERAIDESWMKTLLSDGCADVYKEVIHALSSLSVPRKGRGAEFVDCEPRTEVEPNWFLDPRIGGVCNHATRLHMPRDLHRYLFVACFGKARGRSPTLRDFPKQLLPAHFNVPTALKHGNFDDRFRVQLAGRPSTTITSHIAKDGHYYIHYDPTQCRSLTVREAARLQTFPDNYLFCGHRTAQYTQVGNAVPPLMAREIAGIVWDLLR